MIDRNYKIEDGELWQLVQVPGTAQSTATVWQFVCPIRQALAAPKMLSALKQVELYARVNHTNARDYGEVVADAIQEAGGRKS